MEFSSPQGHRRAETGLEQEGRMRKTGEILMELRKEKGLGQKELAKLWNLSIATISNYENDIHAPDLNMLCERSRYALIAYANYLNHRRLQTALQ